MRFEEILLLFYSFGPIRLLGHLLCAAVAIKTIVNHQCRPTHPECEVIAPVLQRLYDDGADELEFQHLLLIICTIRHQLSEH